MEKTINKGEKNIKEKKGKTRNGGEKIMSTGDEIIKTSPRAMKRGETIWKGRGKAMKTGERRMNR